MNSLTLFLLLIFSPFPIQSQAPIFSKEALPTKSGYLPIDSTPSPNSLFYAFYEAQHPTSPLSRTPLLIWLQGGPGCSSLLGNFFELGPFLVSDRSPSLRPNPFSWNRLFGLLFIDNPIGTGFSIAASPADIPRNQSAVAAHLFAALRLFLSSDASFGSRPVYITGESYAGKYVPALGYYILRRNDRASERNDRVNLAGVAIGNGLTHPVVQVGTHAATGYFTGLISGRQKEALEELQKEAVWLTNQGNWSAATHARSRVLRELQNVTGLGTLYDLRKKKPYQSEMVALLLNNEEVKASLGAKKELQWVECSEVVSAVLHEDVMKSVKFMVEELVRRSKVLLYQGMFDLRDGVVSTEAWIKEMEWEGLESFLDAERKVWKVNGEVAGYVQRSGSLTQVIVSGAGHLVPADQGMSSQAMIEDWVLENGLFGNSNVPKRVVPTVGGSHC